MGSGIISTLKPIIPISIILFSVFLILRALSGRLEWSLMFLIMLLPLRNVVEKLHAYPLGKDLIDVFFSKHDCWFVYTGNDKKGKGI